MLIGVFLFALTIRGYDFGAFSVPVLGMSVATPLAIIFAGAAAKDVRFGELLIFTAVLTVICIGLFRFALGLSLPVAPWLIGYCRSTTGASLSGFKVSSSVSIEVWV